MITRLMLNKSKDGDNIINIAFRDSVKHFTQMPENPDSTSLTAIPEISATLRETSITSPVQRRQLIKATTDRQAAEVWANNHKSAATRANYQKDVERFLLWCHAHDRTLNTLTVEDLMSYAAFLADPQPAVQWVSKKRFPKSDPRWRPFQGPLSVSSQRQAMIAVLAMLRWLTDAAYLGINPGRLIKVDKIHRNKVDRYIPWSAVRYVLDAADQGPEKTLLQMKKKARNRFLVALFVLTGARLGDVPGATMGSLAPSQRGSWWWRVKGKGAKIAKIPAPDDLVIEFKRYRVAMGLSEHPVTDDDRAAPLIPALRGGTPADETTLYVAIKGIIQAAVTLAKDAGDSVAATFLSNASPHFLRHTALTRQADEKMDLRWVQENGRHEDINTTMGYLHTDDEERHAATNDAMKLPKQAPE